MTATKLGIWMDHDHAYLTEFTTDPLKTQANKQWDGLLDSILAATANHVTTVSMEELIFAN